MSDVKLEVIDKTLNSNDVNNVVVENPEVKPEVTPEVKPEVKPEVTYEEQVRQNVATGHDKVKLTQELLGKFGDNLSPTVIEAIVADAEETAKEKINSPGYDPTKYADITRTDAMILAKRVVQNKIAAAEEQRNNDKIDYMNAIDEFGINNIHRREEALKWYAKARGVPLELVQKESVADKMHIYKAYTSNRVPETFEEKIQRTKTAVRSFLGMEESY